MPQKDWKQLSELERARYYLRYSGLITVVSNDKLNCITFLGDLADVFEEHKCYQQAEECYSKSIALVREVYGDPSVELGCEYGKLANLYFKEGSYERARCSNALSWYALDRCLGDDATLTCLAMFNQAYLERHCGNTKLAESMYLKAEQRFQRLGQPASLLTIITANVLAEINLKQNRFAESEKWYRLTLHLLEQHHSANTELESTIKNNLNYVLSRKEHGSKIRLTDVRGRVLARASSDKQNRLSKPLQEKSSQAHAGTLK
jgi:tetratricopeptide (TPR) repeat protein